jgi:uncharacterized protein YbjT (DUF2867 family)
VANVVLLTGATGFVGSRVLPRLVAAGFHVRCASRHPERASGSAPNNALRDPRRGTSWIRLDVSKPETVRAALDGVRAAIYLVHGMAEGAGYEERERAAAVSFRDEARARGVERIVYLGGVAPRGPASHHLESRLRTGALLREGAVPVFELRAGMIVGHGSTSFRIVRDLAFRLPVMVLPRWLASESEPIAIDDVAFAIERALALPLEHAGIYDLPGPERLSAKRILVRVAALRGSHPLMVSVPFLTPRLSSYWLKLVSGADFRVARELVAGLESDLVATGRSFWELVPEHRLMSFDTAARRAVEEEGARGSVSGLAPRSRPKPAE